MSCQPFVLTNKNIVSWICTMDWSFLFYTHDMLGIRISSVEAKKQALQPKNKVKQSKRKWISWWLPKLYRNQNGNFKIITPKLCILNIYFLVRLTDRERCWHVKMVKIPYWLKSYLRASVWSTAHEHTKCWRQHCQQIDNSLQLVANTKNVDVNIVNKLTAPVDCTQKHINCWRQQC